MKKRIGFTLLATSLALSGCASKSIRSTLLIGDEKAKPGLVYALPKGLLKVTLEQSATKGLTFNAQPVLVPDSKYRYRASFLASAFADDDFSLTVNESGLLSAGKVVNADQMSAILAEIAGLAAAELKFRSNTKTNQKAPKTFKFESLVDPFDSKSVADFDAKLAKVTGKSYSIKFSASPALNSSLPKSTITPEKQNCSHSLCFRVPTPVYVSVHKGKSKYNNSLAVKTAMLPDSTFTGGIDVTRASCVAKTTGLTFSNGMLTKYDINKPSEALACLKIPARIIDAVLGGWASKITTQKTTNLKNEKALIDAQVSLLEAQQKLLKAQADTSN